MLLSDIVPNRYYIFEDSHVSVLMFVTAVTDKIYWSELSLGYDKKFTHWFRPANAFTHWLINMKPIVDMKTYKLLSCDQQTLDMIKKFEAEIEYNE